MKNKIAVVLLVVALLSIAAWSSQGQTEKLRSVSYEYQVLTDPTGTEGMEQGLKRLNDLGAQGWELAGVSQRGNVVPTLYFKRVKKAL